MKGVRAGDPTSPNAWGNEFGEGVEPDNPCLGVNAEEGGGEAVKAGRLSTVCGWELKVPVGVVLHDDDVVTAADVVDGLPRESGGGGKGVISNAMGGRGVQGEQGG